MKRGEYLIQFRFILAAIVFNYFLGSFQSLFHFWRFEWIPSFFINSCFFVFFIRQIPRMPEIFQRDKCFLISVILFIFFLLFQSLYSLDPFRDLKAAVRYFFLFGAIFLSFGACIYYPQRVVSALIKVAILFFASVLIFYPYIIISSDVSLLGRLSMNIRSSFLLGAANEDASVLACFLPFVLAMLRGRRAWSVLFVLFFLVAMIYNGTRTMFILSILTIFIFYFIFLKKKLLATLVCITAFLFSIPFTIKAFSIIFEREGVFQAPISFFTGQYVGGTLSYRISGIWFPMVRHTIQNSFLFGFGTNSWDRIGKDLGIGFSVDGIHFLTAAPHNLFISNFIQWGIVGFCILAFQYALFSWKAFFLLRRCNMLSLQERKISFATFFSWVIFLCWSLFANSMSLVGSLVSAIIMLLIIAQENIKNASFLKKGQG